MRAGIPVIHWIFVSLLPSALGCSPAPEYETRYYDPIYDPAPDVVHRADCTGGEPEMNDWADVAVPLPDVDPCGAASSTGGVLAGAEDVDYFEFRGNGKLDCGAAPRASASGGVGLCIFPLCSVGGTQLNSCKRGERKFSSADLIGCCDEAGQPELDQFSCTDKDPSNLVDATIYLRAYVGPDGSDECVSYSIEYSY